MKLMVHIFGIDPSEKTTGICHLLYNSEKNTIEEVNLYTLNKFKALMYIVRLSDKWVNEKFIIAVEDANTNTGHVIEMVGGKKKRVYKSEKAQGAGFAKANTALFVQMAESSKQFEKVLISIIQTHNKSRKIQALSLIKQLNKKKSSIHELEATVCACIGFEFYTKRVLEPHILIK